MFARKLTAEGISLSPELKIFPQWRPKHTPWGFLAFATTMMGRFGMSTVTIGGTGTEGSVLIQRSPYLWYERPVAISRCGEKTHTRPGALVGFEPGTSRMQSGALRAWPQCPQSFNCECIYSIYTFCTSVEKWPKQNLLPWHLNRYTKTELWFNTNRVLSVTQFLALFLHLFNIYWKTLLLPTTDKLSYSHIKMINKLV